MFDLTRKTVRIADEVELSLKNFNMGKCDKLKNLVNGINTSRYESEKSGQLIVYLEDAKNSSNLIERDHKSLVEALIEIPLSKHNEDLWKSYKDFVMTLLASSPIHLFSVIKQLFKKFIEELPEDLEGENLESDHNKVCAFIHIILAEISRTFPASLQMMERAIKVPTFRVKTILLKVYAENILKVTQYQYKLRMKVLTAIVETMCELDSFSSKQEIEQCEESDSDDEYDEEEDNDTDMKHEQANTLDVLMELCFKFFYQTCHDANGNLNSKQANKLFEELIDIFFSKILHLHKIYHVQFLMFYLCSFDKNFVSKFLNKLWEKLKDFNTDLFMRGNCACYIASFLSRAKFVDQNTVKKYLKLMSDEALLKLKNTDSNEVRKCNTVVNRQRYKIFYYLCQALFYTVLFRLESFTSDGSSEGERFLQSLPMDRLIKSDLNPLKSCFSLLVDLFNKYMKIHQIVYTEAIVKENKREGVPVDGVDVDPNNPLKSIFPFDEYILKRSKTYVEGDWLEWWAKDEEDDDDDDEEEEENMEVTMADETIGMDFNQLNEDLLNNSLE